MPFPTLRITAPLTKTKVRCSGTPTSACINCVKQNTTCQFDLNRRRRGPRPKRTNVEQEHQSSVADPVPGSRSTPMPTPMPMPIPMPTPPAETLSDPRDVFFTQDTQDRMGQIDDSFHSDAMTTWRECLVDLLGGESYYLNGFDILSSPSVFVGLRITASSHHQS